MEALIVAIAALIVIVLLEVGYAIARSVVRWAPSLAIGFLAVWLAHRHGLSSLETLGLGALAALLARRALRPRDYYVDEYRP